MQFEIFNLNIQIETCKKVIQFYKPPAWYHISNSYELIEKTVGNVETDNRYMDLRGEKPLEPLKKAVYFNFILGE